MTVISYYDSPLGRLLLAARENSLAGLWMEGQKHFPYALQKAGAQVDDHPMLLRTKDWLDRYFAGERPDIAELKLAPEGSEFQKQVWLLLCQIPYGQVTTYGCIAKELAAERGLSSMSAQAVGSAVGHNPISILIPCHRVVGSKGQLTGYAGGLERKKLLLALESASGGLPRSGALR